MLAGLGHDAFVGRDDEQRRVDAADAGEHVLDEVDMAGHVDDADHFAVWRASAPAAGGSASQAKPRSMVISRSFSSRSRSGSMPVRARTSVDLP